MTIEELNDKHFSIASSEGWENNPFEDEHTNLSIQFAIEVLENMVKGYKDDIDQDARNLTEWGLGYRGCSLDTLAGLQSKIQEFKKYLNEKV